MKILPPEEQQLAVSAHAGFDGIAYTSCHGTTAQMGNTLMDSPYIGTNGVTVSMCPGLAGMPLIGYSNNRMVAHSAIAMPGFFRAVGLAPYGSQFIERVSSMSIGWMANNHAIADKTNRVKPTFCSKKPQNMHGKMFVTSPKVSDMTMRRAGTKRSYTSSGLGHTWDPYGSVKPRKKPKLLRKCCSILHNPGDHTPPAVHGPVFFGKNMCERCFTRSIRQDGHPSDVRTVARSVTASQSASGVLDIATPVFAARLKRVLSKFRWWMVVAGIDMTHFASPTLTAGVVSLDPMEAHASAMMDHPLLWPAIYKQLHYGIVMVPQQPVQCLRNRDLANTGEIGGQRPILALHGMAVNRSLTPGRREFTWSPKPRDETRSVLLRWASAADTVHTHVALLFFKIGPIVEHIVTRECARVWSAILTGKLVIDIDLVPPLPRTEWRTAADATCTERMVNASRTAPFKVGQAGCHSHEAPYENAQELSWTKLHSFFKNHADLVDGLEQSAKYWPLRLKLKGSLTAAVARVTRTYGPTTIRTGAVFEALVDAASIKATPHLTVSHGAWSDPLAYVSRTDPKGLYATAALEMEMHMLSAAPAVLGRFEAAVAALQERCGTAGLPVPHAIGEATAAERSILRGYFIDITWASETHAGNMGFDLHTRKLAGIGAEF